MLNAKYQFLADCMGQSAMPFGLIDGGKLRLVSGNDALQRLLRLHMVSTGEDFFRQGKALHACLVECQRTAMQQRHSEPQLHQVLELTPVMGADGQVEMIQCVGVAATAASTPTGLEGQFQRMVTEFPHNIWMCSRQGEIFWTNQTSNLYTYGLPDVQDFSNLRWIDKIHPDDFEQVNVLLSQAILQATPVDGFKWRLRDHTGAYQWFLMSAWPFRGDDGQVLYWVGVNVNIDAIQQQHTALQAQIERSAERHQEDKDRLIQAQHLVAQTQKMEVVSSLAGGVAHDLNNLLFVMGLYTDLLANSRTDESRREHLKVVTKSIRKAARLANQLMSFSGRKPQSVTLIDASELVKGIEDILQQAVGAEATLALQVADDAGTVSADRTYLENALINLVINARDAVSGNGRVEVKVRNQSVLHNGEDTHFVVFEVCDNGSGMSPEVQARIFEPFFTTKALGKGTGLGLPMVLNFAQSTGGFVDVTSAPGTGSCIAIHLPSCTDATQDDEAQPEGHVSQGVASILLIEDDLDVRDALATILYQLGYTITTAFNPSSAIRFLHNGLAVDLIISDVRMPGKMTVLDLVHELERSEMNIPIIFATAYSADIVVKEGLIEGKHPVLFKPFSMHELSDMITTMLGQA